MADIQTHPKYNETWNWLMKNRGAVSDRQVEQRIKELEELEMKKKLEENEKIKENNKEISEIELTEEQAYEILKSSFELHKEYFYEHLTYKHGKIKGCFPNIYTPNVIIVLSDKIDVVKNNQKLFENPYLRISKELNEKIEIEQKKTKEVKVFENEKNFNYNSTKPEKEIETIEQLKEIIIKNFPTIWFETKACLSVYSSMSLKNLNGCPSLNLIGNPSGEKTTALSFFYGQGNSYLSDDFTPRAFVSHSANVSKEELSKVDLLPKLQNRVLLTPELAPLFEAPKEKLLDNFAILTRVLDGEGLNRDSGVHGHRGYSGDYKFGWIGASTPLRNSVWNIMGKFGNRLFFLNMNEKNRTDEDFVEMFMGESYEEKIKECRGVVQNFLNNFYKKYPLRSLKWEKKEQDIFILKEIIKYSKLLSKLRGSVITWNMGEEGKLGHNLPIIEEPPRAINSLLNFAKGHALIHGREYLIKEDLELVRKICLSSMPYDRFKFLELLMKHEGRLTTEIIEKELNCSQDTALRTMKTFEILGVVKIKNLLFGQGRPSDYVELEPEFNDLLQHTQGVNSAINSKSQEINPAYIDFSELDKEFENG